MRSSTRLTIAFALVAALVTSGFGSATAASADGGPVSTGPSYGPGDPHAADDPHSTAPLEYDLAVYSIATANGIDLKSADAWFEQQQQFSSIGSDLARRYGTSQFDVWITTSASGQAFHLRTDNAAVSAAFADRFGSSIDIVAAPAQVDALSNELNNINDVPADVDGIYVDPETLGVVVDSHGSDAAATAKAVQSLLDPGKFPGKVAVTIRPDAARNSASSMAAPRLTTAPWDSMRPPDLSLDSTRQAIVDPRDSIGQAQP